MVESEVVELRGPDGAKALLVISRLPRGSDTPERRNSSAIVVVREACIYRFQFDGIDEIARVEPAELFNCDDDTWRTGRLTPREAVGLVAVELTTLNGKRLKGEFEVKSAKFADEQAFGQMLADLAKISIEAMHQGFAPSAGQFGSGAGASPHLLYQKFAILHSLMVGSDLPWAISEILSRPYRAWESQTEPSQPGRPLRGSSKIRRQIGRPGPRVGTGNGPRASLPRILFVERTEETTDNIPNRFVMFVLEGWRALAEKVLLNSELLSGSAQRRGVGQAREMLTSLEEQLASPVFREVSRLSIFPGDNQVLLRREGYREIFSSWVLVEGSLGLQLNLDDLLLVSRRNIATLYEYWTFVRLAQAVAKACGVAEIGSDLFKPSANGMSLVLQVGVSKRLRFNVCIDDVELVVELFFNKEFQKTQRTSWTRPMRPDASLLMRRPGGEEVWLHFDAKYRVDWVEPFETGGVGEEEESEKISGVSKRTDILKMHAYRDAIFDSAGSYVLFPGSKNLEYRQFNDEFLPGLGAFPLRPDMVEDDSAQLTEFIERAIAHVAAAATRHRRATYWSSRAYREIGTGLGHAAPPLGEMPPADTAVLLGYVKSEDHWRWILQNELYNLRSGSRPGSVDAEGSQLDAPLVLLYGLGGVVGRMALFERQGNWEGCSAQLLERLNYPDQRGDMYLVTRLRPLESPAWFGEVSMSRLLPPSWLIGRPFFTTWLDVVLSAQG